MEEKRRKFKRVLGKTASPGKPIDGLFVSVDEMADAFGKPEQLKAKKPRVILWNFETRAGADRFAVFTNKPQRRSEVVEMHIISDKRPIVRCPGYCRGTSTNYSVWLVNRLIEKSHEAAKAAN